MVVGIFGVEGEGLLEGGDAVVRTPVGNKCVAQFMVSSDVIRLRLHGIAIGGNGAVQIAFAPERVAQIDACCGVSRAQRQGGRVVANGFVPLGRLTIVEGNGEIVISPEVVGQAC